MSGFCARPAAAADISPLLDQIDTHAQVETRRKVFNYVTTPDIAALLRHRDLPKDPSVNLKGPTDPYIAVSPAVDTACKAVIASPVLAAA